jgi:hypothetical protein
MTKCPPFFKKLCAFNATIRACKSPLLIYFQRHKGLTEKMFLHKSNVTFQNTTSSENCIGDIPSTYHLRKTSTQSYCLQRFCITCLMSEVKVSVRSRTFPHTTVGRGIHQSLHPLLDSTHSFEAKIMNVNKQLAKKENHLKNS